MYTIQHAYMHNLVCAVCMHKLCRCVYAICVRMCVYTSVCVWWHACCYILLGVHIHTHARTHARTHAHTHTVTHMCCTVVMMFEVPDKSLDSFLAELDKVRECQ